LQDVHFVIHPDHENLTRAYFTGSAKVYRWKMFMQEFSYSIVHVKGENNVVAEALLRLCPDFMHNDAKSERHESESVDILAGVPWTNSVLLARCSKNWGKRKGNSPS
jgi:hypothetical protein